MTKHNYQITKRFIFGAEGQPLFHRIIIETGVLLTMLLCILRGPINISAGTANGSSQGENPGGLAARFEVDAISRDGRYPGGKLKNVVPRSVLRRHVFDKGFYQNDLNNQTGITGAAGTPSATLNLPFRLRFAIPGLVKPIETALRLDKYKQVMLKITNGAHANMLSGNDRTWDFTGVVWDVVEFREYVDDGNAPYYPLVVLYEEDIVTPILAASRRMAFDNVLSSSEAYLDILWIAETTNLALSDAIVNEVFLKTGAEQFFDQINDHIKAEQQEYVTDQPGLTGLTAPTGLYYTPCSKDVGQERALLAGAVPDLGATLDVSHPGTDQITLSSRRVASVPA